MKFLPQRPVEERFARTVRSMSGGTLGGTVLSSRPYKAKQPYSFEAVEGLSCPTWTDVFAAPTTTVRGLGWHNGELLAAEESSKTVKFIDPSDGSVTASIPTPAGRFPWGVTSDGTSLWIIDRPTVGITKITELDPSDGTVLSQFDIANNLAGAGSWTGCVWTPDGIWASETTTNYLRLYETDGTYVREIPAPGDVVTGVVLDDSGNMWVTDTNASTPDPLYAIDPADGTVLVECSAGSGVASGLGWGDGSLWQSDSFSDRIWRGDF